MNKIWKIFQYGYLIIAIVFIERAVSTWNSNRNEAYLFIGFSIFIILVFFFKRHFRKKIEKRNHQN